MGREGLKNYAPPEGGGRAVIEVLLVISPVWKTAAFRPSRSARPPLGPAAYASPLFPRSSDLC